MSDLHSSEKTKQKQDSTLVSGEKKKKKEASLQAASDKKSQKRKKKSPVVKETTTSMVESASEEALAPLSKEVASFEGHPEKAIELVDGEVDGPVKRPELGPWLEKVLTGFSGGALVAYGLKKGGIRGWAMAALGGSFLYKSLAGRGSTYKRVQAWRYNRDPANQSLVLEGSILVHRTAEEIHQVWTNVEGLPSLFGAENVVATSSMGRFTWRVFYGEVVLDLEAEMLVDVPGKILAWQSPIDATISHEGVVQFSELHDHKATEVKLMLKFDPPFGEWRERLFGTDPNQMITKILLHFKESMESRTVWKK